MTRLEVRIGGLGGQGVITAGFILGHATCLFDRKNAVQTQSYGPEARGSACRSDIVISDEEIDYPKVIKPDILVTMSQEAYVKYGKELKKGGTLIIDLDLVKPGKLDPAIKVYKAPAVGTAESVLGNKMVANVIMLGALTAITHVVSPEAMEKSIRERFPKYADLNIKAFQKGMELGRTALKAEK